MTKPVAHSVAHGGAFVPAGDFFSWDSLGGVGSRALRHRSPLSRGQRGERVAHREAPTQSRFCATAFLVGGARWRVRSGRKSGRLPAPLVGWF